MNEYSEVISLIEKLATISNAVLGDGKGGGVEVRGGNGN